jgi:hypothetical protein
LVSSLTQFSARKHDGQNNERGPNKGDADPSSTLSHFYGSIADAAGKSLSRS